MATASVRKFALSPDPDDVIDFSEDLDYFARTFDELGFERTGTYTWRFRDRECMLKGELTQSKDGFYVLLYVQAMDEHAFRVKEVAEAFGAYVVEGARPRR